MERRIVDDAYRFARDLIPQREEMREVILAERRIVVEESAYALLFLRAAFALQALCGSEALYLPTMFLPLLLDFL